MSMDLLDNSDHCLEEDDDDDIIVIRDQAHHEHSNHNVASLEASRLYSPSQRHTTPQPRYVQRNPRRRQQREKVPAGTVAVLAASQEEAQAHLFSTSPTATNSDQLNQSNAFAGLESLLDQQQFTMSMTQEKENEEDDDEKEPADCDGTMQQDLPREPNHQPHESDVVANSRFDETKENSRNHIPPTDSNVASETAQPKAKQLSRTVDNGCDAMATLEGSVAVTNLRPRSEEDVPPRSDTEVGFTPMFQENHCEESPQQHSANADKPFHDLDRELLKQRERHKSYRRKTKRSTHTNTHANNSPTMMAEDVQPSKVLRQQLQKDRHDRKTGRSKSADRIHLQDRTTSRPHKRAVRPRSSSPMTRVSSKSPTVEKANQSLVGSRPAHWGRHPAGPSPRGPAAHLDSFDGRGSTAAMLDRQRKQLADACNSSSFLMAPPARRRNLKPNHRMRFAHASPAGPTTDASVGPVNASAADTRPNPHPLLSNQFGKSVFAAHGHAREDPMEIDQIDDNMSDDMEENDGSSANTSFLATARTNSAVPKGSGRRKSFKQNDRKGDGPGLLQLLQKIRTEVRTDRTRLRSGEYSFPHKVSSRFDLYDPRNRATSYLDVTLVGESWYQCHDSGNSNPRGRQSRPTNSTMIILSYIHAHQLYPERQKQHAVPSAQTSNCLAWVNFSGETIQEHSQSMLNSPQGSQLRIYNSVIVPVVLDARVDGAKDTASTQVCRYNVVCTQLCEPYPTNILGPLEPSLAQILESHEFRDYQAATLAP